jgi:hypothetical protein
MNIFTAIIGSAYLLIASTASAEATRSVALREYDVLRSFPPGRLAALSAGDKPDAQGFTGSNRAAQRWHGAGAQRGSCRAVIAAVVAGNLEAADDAWRGIDTAFAHQRPDVSRA